jgi:drug/metabolite transporter (DMT)-like permease
LKDSGRPSPAKLYSLVGLMVLLWSINFIVAKIALRDFPAPLLGVMRFVFAGLLVVPFYAWRRQYRTTQPHEARDRLRLVLLGLLGIGLNQLFFVIGIGKTSVGHASFLMALTPVWVLLIAVLAKQEVLSLRKATGLTLAVIGVAVLQAAPSRASAGATAVGDLFIFLSSFTFSLFTVFGKAATSRFGSLTMNTYAFASSALVLAPPIAGYYWGFDYTAPSLSSWLSLLYMALFPSLLCYLIYYYALTYIPATRISAFSYLQPLLATSMAIPLLGETLSSTLLAGGALILAGVSLTERS